jgi:ABC-type multidrug transport system ATPase subunit
MMASRGATGPVLGDTVILRITIDGHDLWREEIQARRFLAHVPEHPDLTPYASVLEVLLLVCRLRGAHEGQARTALERVHLTDRAHASVNGRQDSGGVRSLQRRGLGLRVWCSSTNPSS